MKKEKALIGLILQEKRVPENFNTRLFLGEKTKKIAEEILLGKFDLLYLYEKFDPIFIAGCITESNGITSIESGIKILEQDRAKERIKEVTNKAIKALDEKDAIEVSAELAIDALGIADSRKKEQTDVLSIIEEVTESQLAYASMVALGQKTIGIPTGFKIIDDNISGLRPAHLVVISAYTNVGKTTFAMNIAHNVLKQGKRVVIFSLEMSRADLFSKLVALEGDMPMSEVVMAGANNKRYEQYTETVDRMRDYDLSIYSEKHSINEILTTMRAENDRKKVDLFIIDYLQNLTGEQKTEYELLTKSVQDLQATISKIGSTCIAISQISNEDRKAKALSINGKGTGAIRAASDLFLYLSYAIEDEKLLLEKLNSNEPIPMYAIINKNRHGRLGAAMMTRNPLSGQFYEND